MWKWQPRAPQRLTIEVTKGVGELTKRYRLDVPANTSFDDIEALLMIVGAIPPQITGTPEPVKIDAGRRGGGTRPRR